MDVLWTSGCGDVIALESTWSEEERAALSTCYWATKAAGITRPLFERSARYRHVKHVVLPSIPGKTHYNILGVRGDYPSLPSGIRDWSVMTRFREFSDRPWTRSTFLTEPADAAQICADLPDRFVLIQHETTLHTTPAQRQLRNLDAAEWDRVIARLEAENLSAVVVNGADTSAPPRHPLIVDLVGRTDFVESMAVLRNACGYWGIASALCVAASQLFDPDQLWVKGPEAWLFANRHIYFAPHPAEPMPFLFSHLCSESPRVSVASNVKTLEMKTMRPWRGELVCSGSLVEATAAEAENLIRTGQAEIYDPAKPLRTAAIDPVKRKAVRGA